MAQLSDAFQFSLVPERIKIGWHNPPFPTVMSFIDYQFRFNLGSSSFLFYILSLSSKSEQSFFSPSLTLLSYSYNLTERPLNILL